MSVQIQKVQLGSLTLDNPFLLAPLAGVSDVPFRRLNQKFGASLTYVEMLSAKALIYENKQTLSLLERHPDENRLGVQVTGSDPEDLGEAIRILDRYDFDTIDLNLGCPVRKVVQSGCGAALMRDLEKLKKIFGVCRESTSKPLTAKFRLGWSREELNADRVAALAFEMGLDGITLHGRTRSERYDKRVDHALIGQVFAPYMQEESFWCVGNGDVFGYKDWILMERAHSKGVMVSRGALGNPWIFQELSAQRPVAPTLEDWKDTVFSHLEYQEEHYGDHDKSAKLMRKHLIWYASGFPGMKQLRPRLGLIQSLKEARSLIEAFVKEMPLDLTRTVSSSKYEDPKDTAEIIY